MYKSATFENDVVELSKHTIDNCIKLKDVKDIGIDYSNLTTPELNEDTFGGRLRKSRLELGLSVSKVADLCNVTKSVMSGYELNRYTPTKEVLKLLSSKFDTDYLCMEGYTKLVYSFDEFLGRLKLWMKENNLTRLDASNKLGISPSLFKFWFNGGTISINTYNKIKNNLNKYTLT